MAWDPQQYALFGSHRGRPFVDLLSRVAATEPAVVVDLGCGDGPLTLSLTERWPGARVVGVDSSPQMLAAARELDDQRRVAWVETRAEDWDPGSLGAPIDVLVSNAALQWVPGHLDLFSRWVDALAPDGTDRIEIDRALTGLARDLGERRNPTVFTHGAVTIRFGVELGLERLRAQQLEMLSSVVLAMLDEHQRRA